MIKMAPQVKAHISEQETKKRITEPIDLTFHKEGNTWLVYDRFLWENGMKASCTMVAGTGELLDMLSGSGNKVTLHISQTYIPDYEIYLVSAQEGASFDGEEGGDYLAAGYEGNLSFGNYKIWLCMVCKYIFGFYPQVMWIKTVKDE